MCESTLEVTDFHFLNLFQCLIWTAVPAANVGNVTPLHVQQDSFSSSLISVRFYIFLIWGNEGKLFVTIILQKYWDMAVSIGG